jgi:hypothetical protein
MSSPIQVPEAPLSALDLFPVYLSAEEYKQATGKDAPAYNPSLPKKTWFDPDALSTPNGLRADGAFFATTAAIYPLLTAVKDSQGNWQAQTGVLELDRPTAAAVNIPKAGAPIPPNANKETVAVPRRGLDPAESLAQSPNMMDGVVVENKTLEAQARQQQDIAAGKFLPSDRALLEAIAAKLSLPAGPGLPAEAGAALAQGK